MAMLSITKTRGLLIKPCLMLFT